MSGGSYDYVYSKVQMYCENNMHDEELDMFIDDFIKILHDLEWWQSADYSEEEYRNSVKEFKDKWFRQNQTMEIAVRRIKDKAIKQIELL